MKWTTLGFAFHFLLGCTASFEGPDGVEPTGKAIKDDTKTRERYEEGSLLTIRELGVNGSITLRKVSLDDLSREHAFRVFAVKGIEAPHMANNDPRAGIEDWELFGVIKALLTRDVRWAEVGKMDFDRQTAVFIVKDAACP